MNLFSVEIPPRGAEKCEVISGDGKIRIERIVSNGSRSPDGFWYDQNETEWVTVLQGEARLTVGNETKVLSAGDEICLLPHQKHRVEQTSSQPPCIWLCVFY